jgi:biotin carboxyl carrier protein
MKLKAEIDGQTADVEIFREGDRVRANVDGREYELETSSPEPNVILFRLETAVHEVALIDPADPTDPIVAVIGGSEFAVRVLDPRKLRSGGSGGSSADGVVEIRTAMPGKVIRILTEEGAVVKKGDGIVVVEAMKMQNELRSPKDGVVLKINAAEGSTVNGGEILAVIE